jgi:phosphate/sulfate permease
MKLIDIRSKMKGKLAAAAAGATAVALTAGNALAVDSITDMFAAVDITGVQTAVYTFLVALIGIGLLFFGRRLLARMGVSV